MAFRGKTKKTPISKRPPCSEHRFSIFRCWHIPVKNLHSLVGLAAKLQIGRSWRPASGKLRSHVTKVVNLPPLYPHLFLFHCTKFRLGPCDLKAAGSFCHARGSRHMHFTKLVYHDLGSVNAVRAHEWKASHRNYHKRTSPRIPASHLTLGA